MLVRLKIRSINHSQRDLLSIKLEILVVYTPVRASWKLTVGQGRLTVITSPLLFL